MAKAAAFAARKAQRQPADQPAIQIPKDRIPKKRQAQGQPEHGQDAKASKRAAPPATAGGNSQPTAPQLPSAPQPKSVSSTDAAQPQSEQPARVASETDPEPKGYQTQCKRIDFYKRFLSLGFAVLVHGLKDLADIVLPLSLEAQSERTPSDETKMKHVVLQNLRNLLHGTNVLELNNHPLSTHVELKFFVTRLRMRSAGTYTFECRKLNKNGQEGSEECTATMGKAISLTAGFTAVRAFTNALIREVEETVTELPMVKAVDDLGIFWWIDDDTKLELAVAGCFVLQEKYAFLEMVDLSRNFQHLAAMTRERSVEALGQLQMQKWDSKGANKAYWQAVMSATGMFAQVVAERPPLKDLAMLCLTITRSACAGTGLGPCLSRP